MILGKISKNDKVVRINIEIYCTNCRKRVPGGIKTSERFSNSKEYDLELKRFLKNYLCGVCRDKERTIKN